MNSFTKSAPRNLKKLSLIALLSISGLMIQSCSKSEEPPLQEVSFVNIINTSPTTGTFNFYVNQTKINTDAVAFGGVSGYLRVPPGSHSFKFTTASSPESLLTKTKTLEANGIVSLFLINKGANLDLLEVKDEIGNVNSDKAFVRFINLSPDAPALDLAVKEGSVIISDKAYKATSAFIEVEAKSYIFQIKAKEAGTPVQPAEMASAELKAGFSYTIVARGMVTKGETDQAFGGQIITNR